MSLHDNILIHRVKQGDMKAFAALVVKYQRRVHGVVARYISDPQERPDVIQEIFLKTYRGLLHFRGDAQFFTWLYRIACNTAKNHLLAKTRRLPDHDIEVTLAETLGLEELEENASPEQLMIRDEIEETVYKAIRSLPNSMQNAIVMREIEGLSYEAIAAQMDCPVGTVRSRISRAREMIDLKVKPLLMD